MRSPNKYPQIDLVVILTIAGRVLRSRAFVVILLLGALATGFQAYTGRPIYRSEAVLLYQDRGGSNPVAQRDMPAPRRVALSLQELLFSHALLEKLIGEFGLYPDVVARFGLVGAADELQKQHLFFIAPRDGYSFRIAFESTRPDVAQLVTARAAQLLIQAQLDASAQKSEETKSFLDGEKKRAEEELRKRESELAFFAAEHPEAVQASTARAGTAAVDESPSSATAALGLEMQALQLRERLTQMHARPAASSEPSKAGFPQDLAEARSRAETELAAAQHDLADKQAQFTEEYPGVKRAMVRVETAKARLRHLEEKAAIPAAPANANQAPASPGAEPADTQMVREQLALVEKQIRAARSHPHSPPVRPEFFGDPAMQGRMRAEYVELEWRARESRERLSLLESRHFQAEMQSLLESQSKRGDLVVLDPAFKPVSPFRSPRLKIILVGAFASLMIALATGLGLVLKDDRLYRASDVRRFGLPTLLAEVPPP